MFLYRSFPFRLFSQFFSYITFFNVRFLCPLFFNLAFFQIVLEHFTDLCVSIFKRWNSKKTETLLTLSWRRLLSYRNQSIDLLCIFKCQTSKMERFAKIINSCQFTIFAESSIVDVWQCSEYASVHPEDLVNPDLNEARVSTNIKDSKIRTRWMRIQFL